MDLLYWNSIEASRKSKGLVVPQSGTSAPSRSQKKKMKSWPMFNAIEMKNTLLKASTNKMPQRTRELSRLEAPELPSMKTQP